MMKKETIRGLLGSLLASTSIAMAISTSGEARAELAYRMVARTSGIVVEGGRVVMSPNYSFAPAVMVTSRVVGQLAGPNCRAFVQNAQYTGNPRPLFAQRMNRFPDGSFEVAFGTINWVAFEITQPYGTPTSLCDLNFFALLETGAAPVPVTPVPNPVPNPQNPNPQDPSHPSDPAQPGTPVDAPEQLVGVVNYSGGFGRDLPVVQSGRNPLDGIVIGIRVAIPDFCKQAEVLGAGTISEGKYDPATPADNIHGAYIVNGGQGLRASDILVTLNGPFDAQCSVPVYVKVKK